MIEQLSNDGAVDHPTENQQSFAKSQTALPLLSVNNLKTYFNTPSGVAKVVDGISFELEAGKTLAIVGESGSGKSMLARSIMGLVPMPPGFAAGGDIIFAGKNLRSLSETQLNQLRGKDMGMIFQDPMSSLNPVLTIGEQIGEVLIQHLKLNKQQARDKATSLLSDVGIPSPERRVDEYPHQLSGGLRQRVIIAMTIACSPRLLIADEPTTALDVSIQAQILRLLKRYQREQQVAMIFVSHDLGTVAGIADDIAVMYAGKIVEMGPAKKILSAPKMRYTQALLASIPQIQNPPHTRLKVIEGRPPNLTAIPSGCAYAPRCEFSQTKCQTTMPSLVSHTDNHHLSACWFPSNDCERK